MFAKTGIIDIERRAVGAQDLAVGAMSRNTCGWSNGGRAPMQLNSFTPMKIFSAPWSFARWERSVRPWQSLGLVCSVLPYLVAP